MLMMPKFVERNLGVDRASGTGMWEGGKEGASGSTARPVGRSSSQGGQETCLRGVRRDPWGVLGGSRTSPQKYKT